MIQFLNAIMNRLKTLCVLESALDRKAQFLTRHAERKAELMRKAAEHEEQGLPEIADELRQQALSFSIAQHLGTLEVALDSFTPRFRDRQTASSPKPKGKPTVSVSTNGTARRTERKQFSQQAKAG